MSAEMGRKSRRTLRRWGACSALGLWVCLVGIASAQEANEGVAAGESEERTVRTVEERSTVQVEDGRRSSAQVSRVDVGALSGVGEELADGLSSTEGTYVRRVSSYGQSAYLTVRGGNPRQVAVDFDGLRISPPVGVGFDLGRLSLEGIEEAYVYRGAGAALYGGGALMGALRLEPRTVEDGERVLRARVLGGSFGTGAVTGAWGEEVGAAGVYFYGGMRRSEGAFDFVDAQGREHERVNNDHERGHLGGTIQMEWGESELRVSGLWEQGDSGSAGLSEFQRQFQYARVRDERELVVGRWEMQRDYEAVGVDGYVSAGLQRERYDYANREAFLGGEAVETTGVESMVGVRGGVMVFVGDHLVNGEVEVRGEGYQSGGEVRRREVVGLTLGDEWLLWEERISLVGALRVEPARTEGAVDWRAPFPAAGVVWRVLEGLSLRGNLARTFRRPDFDELYLETEGVRGNPDLKAEEAMVSDLSVLWTVMSGVTVQIGGYWNQVDSMILFLPVSAYLYEAQNLEEVVMRGVEVGVEGRIGPWRVRGGYTFTDAFLEDLRGVQLPQQPRHRGFGEVKTRRFGGGLAPRFRVGAHWRSGLNQDLFGNLRNRPFLRIDAGANVRLGERIEANMQVQNLLDYREAEDGLQRPLPGRAVYVTIQLER